MDDVNQTSSGGRWTLAALLLGLAVIALCVILPQADANRRLAYERQRLLSDLDQINHQASVNEEFLTQVQDDPLLAERLAQRQMKFIRQGESVLTYQSARKTAAAGTSPFSLVRVPPPVAPAPYHPGGGTIMAALLDSHIRLYCLGAGLFLVAMALVLGSNEPDVLAGP